MAIRWMCHRITIAGKTINGITDVEVDTTMEALSDVARITLPFMIHNKPFNIEGKFKRGDTVKIELGYNDQYTTEFEGFVRALSVNNPCVIECEDAMYRFRKPIKSKEFLNVSINDIMNYVIGQIGGFKLSSTVGDLKYDKFVIRNASGFEVLEKIKQQFGISIYIRGTKLIANLKYTEKTGDCYFSFSENVKGSNLKWVNGDDVKVQVKIKGLKADNTATKEVVIGTAGGEVITLPDARNITDQTSLELRAKEYLKTLTYTGYRGELVSWGRPYCDVGYSAFIVDRDFPDRDGRYYVKGVKVRFSSTTGYERAVSLGIKL
ncbi:hypothetical protein VB796_20960 [Arcicella sp. LKC2W]|uniref:hypothetical protein n=1 Tax=Arcicella sp. LKC2W TaxID=2984198 RepID=UPI002B205884|nr:hypothetical protein [Arcicella sp. LKC2W]MEA5461550.1 hypothetical protein [Arcicella sp. LKC2W]